MNQPNDNNLKITPISELAAQLAQVRVGKQVVHCHGVFDLLHIGHIRHLKQAKAEGDVLVVTLTPDHFVNKGPGRPAFSQAHRAEALASLEFVDHVAINEWPMAIQAIETIKPDVFIKGSEYRDEGKDQTTAITQEREAIEAIGGRLHFTEDITYSSSNLINEHLDLLPEETKAFLTRFRKENDSDAIVDLINGGKDLKVLVVGDAIIDAYEYCHAIGKSQKEPMLAVKQESKELMAGGIFAVANHVSVFSDHVKLLTVLGEDNTHTDLLNEKMNAGIDAQYVVRPNAPTTLKRRYIDSYFFHKLFSVYEFDDSPLDEQTEAKVCDEIEASAGDFDLVLVVDFGHGMMTERVIETVCKHAKMLVVNAQSNAANLGYHTISKYPRADMICLAESEMRLEARSKYGDLETMMRGASVKFDAQRVMVTQGANGSLCYDRDHGIVHVPSLTGNVKDRMGAGDTLISVASLLAAQGASCGTIGFVGNAAGAQAVATVGNRNALDRVALIRQIQCLMK